MLKHIIDFYKVSAPAPCNGDSLPEQKQRLKRLQWSTFLAATLGYSMYYVCRLSLNVVKKPIVDEGIFSETELGIIGSVLFFTYAIGKFSNGFLADRSNINRFMSTGLLVTALINLCLGFTNSFILFAILWGISGWFQSMGAASCVVGLSRWFTDKDRGSFYGFWSASHNIGEAMTFIIIASVVSALGWRYGFLGAGYIDNLAFLSRHTTEQRASSGQCPERKESDECIGNNGVQPCPKSCTEKPCHLDISIEQCIYVYQSLCGK